MEQVLSHPEIVDPHGAAKGGFTDKTFAKDIGLDALLKSVPFRSPDTRELAGKLLAEFGCDLETARYRQDVLHDLVSDRNLREGVQKWVGGLHELAFKLSRFGAESNLANGLSLLRYFEGLVVKPADLSGAKSEALRNVASYMGEIRASEMFSGLSSFARRMSGVGGVVFKVFVDNEGRPERMTALELIEKDPDHRSGLMAFFERLSGRGRHEEKLKGIAGLNDAGKVIQGLIDRHFVPIVRTYADHIRELCSLREPLDFYSGFAEYFVALKERGFDVCRPTLLPVEERRMAVTKARNPLLKEAGKDGHKVVPNDIGYMASQNMFVMTGPNNGGKTTYVTTVGLVQLLAQKGLFVPAKSAEVSFVDGVYTHFVSPDDITQGEGRYRNELRRIKEIFQQATPYSLVILDEPCGGTSYEEGIRQSLVILDGFHELGSATYLTTHMHLLAKEVDGGRYPAARNFSVDCEYDGKRVNYTYRVVPGAFGKSYGEEIAREVGLVPEQISKEVSKRAEKDGYIGMIRRGQRGDTG